MKRTVGLTSIWCLKAFLMRHQIRKSTVGLPLKCKRRHAEGEVNEATQIFDFAIANMRKTEQNGTLPRLLLESWRFLISRTEISYSDVKLTP